MNIEISAQDRLREAGIRVTGPRLTVYQYLLDNLTHPTCDEIYNGICKDDPSISLASVYNVTDKLVEERLIVKIVSPDGEGHYDSVTSFHGHFFCDKCSEIMDFECHSEKFFNLLKGCTIKNMSYIAEGICAKCNSK